MARVRRNVQIDAQPDEVIEYVADVTNHPAFIPPLNAVTNLDGDPRKPGTAWSWSYAMAGIELQGQATTVDYEPGRRFSFRTSGGIGSTFVYEVQPQGSGTELAAEVEYQVPQSVLAQALDAAAVERLNEGVADNAAANLKAIFED
jgi:uncharacterized membrane protein